MDDSRLKAAILSALKPFSEALGGMLLVQNMLVRELLDQHVLDKEELLATIGAIRGRLAKESTGTSFDAALLYLTKSVLKAGDDPLPADWLEELILKPPKDGGE